VDDRVALLKDIAQWLRRVVEPGMVVELRILGVVDDPRYPAFTMSGYFDSDHLDELAREALKWTGKAEGCYVTINPVVPDLLARAANRVVKRAKHTTTDAEIARRVGLVFDADPKRPAGVSATDTEKALAWERINRLVAELTRRGWPAPVIADSGNGYHARYCIDLPADDGGIIERVLKGASARFSDERVTIDTSLSNSSRIIKLYGTMARKGDPTDDRPHRGSKVLSVPDSYEVVPVEPLEALAAEYQPAGPQPERAHAGTPQTTALSSWGVPGQNGHAWTPEERARAYVFAPGFPDSIAGQRGHDRLYHVACILIDGFGLSRDEAMPIFHDWNTEKARPPETERQIAHKLDDAIKNHPTPTRHLLKGEQRGQAHRDNDHTQPEPEPWPPLRLHEPPPALPFPVEVFPPTLQTYCQEVAATTRAPIDFVGAAMLTVAGAAIGQSVNLRLSRKWREAPLLYTILVARPGRTKSPVIRIVREPLHKIDERVRKQSEEATERWREVKKAHDKDPDNNSPPGPEPPQLRAVVDDVTRASLVIVLKDNPRGVLDDPKEASAWTNSFNEFTGNGRDRQFWLCIYDSEPVQSDRKGGRESTYVPFPFCAVLASTTPAMLGSLTEERGREDGFLERITFVCPDSRAFPPQHWNEAELSEATERIWTDAIERLHGTAMVPAENDLVQPWSVKLTPDGKAPWVQWFNEHVDEMESPDFSERHDGAWSKMKGRAARFALILSRLWSVCGSTSAGDGASTVTAAPADVSARDVEGAIALVDYFKHQQLRLYHEMTNGIGSADAKAVLDWIRRKGIESFHQADVGNDLRRFRDNPAALVKALKVLEASNGLRPKVEPRSDSRRGRKPSPSYAVHPDLLRAPEITANTDNCPRPAFGGSINGNFGNSRRSPSIGSWTTDQASGEPTTDPADREVFEL
jgi:hypothetical protein